VVASLAALGSVIAASSCCLPLLPFLFAAGAAGTSAFVAQIATVPACSVGAADCVWLLQVLASEAMQLQAQPDQHFPFVVLGVCGFCIHLLPAVDRQPGGRPLGRQIMSRKRILLLAVLLVAFGAVYYFYVGHSTPKGQPPLVSFSSGNLTPLKTAFNGSASSIRVVVMLSPT